MQMLKLRTFALGLPLGAALSLCVACGGDDDGGSKSGNGGTSATNGGSSSGGSGNSVSLPSDKPLGTLSDSEVQQLCDDYEAFTSSGSFAANQQEFMCLLSGVFLAAFSAPMTDAELQTACKKGYDECKKAPVESKPAECGKPDASCTATAGELKKCLEDSAKAFEDLVAELPACSELTLAQQPEMQESMEPASCATLREKCPGLATPTAGM